MALKNGQLTKRQEVFCNTYLSNGFNATQAALTAGYSPNSAKQLGSATLSNVDVQKYLDKSMQEAAKRLGIDENYILGKLKRGVDVSIHDDDSKQQDVRAAVSCLSEINKILGHYAPAQTETTTKIPQLGELIEQERSKG